MTRLYLMRHGQTLLTHSIGFKVGVILLDWRKVGEQARQVRAYFEKHDMTFDQYYCTTTERASDTIELATGRTDYQRVKGLKEMHFGIFEGQPEYLHPKTSVVGGILVTTMPSLVGKVKISSLRVWLRVLRRYVDSILTNLF